jgi:plasmid stabilization system protein ParE
MKPRYTLAPEAARDLVEIWRYLKKEGSQETAGRVESVTADGIITLDDAKG